MYNLYVIRKSSILFGACIYVEEEEHEAGEWGQSHILDGPEL